ncbi:MAG: hypothetical protein IPP79_05270 [Chitinophagaceae bacterium]|nr:hypothetical protein [Chitinophagaceae bacterium]
MPLLHQIQMVTVGSLVYFTATDPVKGIELWKTDGNYSRYRNGERYQPWLSKF